MPCSDPLAAAMATPEWNMTHPPVPRLRSGLLEETTRSRLGSRMRAAMAIELTESAIFLRAYAGDESSGVAVHELSTVDLTKASTESSNKHPAGGIWTIALSGPGQARDRTVMTSGFGAIIDSLHAGIDTAVRAPWFSSVALEACFLGIGPWYEAQKDAQPRVDIIIDALETNLKAKFAMHNIPIQLTWRKRSAEDEERLLQRAAVYVASHGEPEPTVDLGWWLQRAEPGSPRANPLSPEAKRALGAAAAAREVAMLARKAADDASALDGGVTSAVETIKLGNRWLKKAHKEKTLWDNAIKDGNER